MLLKLWILAGRLAYRLTQPGIKLVIRRSRRTRVLIVCDDEYLVVKHWLGDDSWMLPGGGRHRNEAPLAAARRELHEELGLQLAADRFEHFGEHECDDNGFRFKYDLYLVQLKRKPDLKLQRIEILSASWFDRQATLPGQASSELAVALVHWPQ